MSNWDTYETDNAQKGTGGDYPPINDDIYLAQISDVSEPETGPDIFNALKERTQFYLTWELLPTPDQVEDGTAEGLTMRQYLSVPPGVKSGVVNEKAKVYEVMTALGFDMEGTFAFRPRNWQGKQARVTVENKANTAGEVKPRITKVMAAARRGPVRTRLGA